MKLRNYFFGALACLALASCSSDDDAIDSGQENTGGNAVIAIKLSMPEGGTTRGWNDPISDGNFHANGDAAEIDVNNVVLYFFDADGKQWGDPRDITESFSSVTDDKDATDKTIESNTKAFVIFNNTKNLPKSVIAVLNAPVEGGSTKKFTATTIEILRKNVESLSGHTTGAFVMSNAVYVNDSKAQYAVSLDGKVKSSTDLASAQTAAKEDPVEIYVERVLARVHVDLLESGKKISSTPQDYQMGYDAANKSTIVSIVDGWWLDNTNQKSFLLKDLSDEYSIFADQWWNSTAYKRSYWANNPDGSTFAHYNYTSKTWGDKYCFENVSQANPTRLVVAATLYKKVADTYTAISLIEHKTVKWEKADFISDVISKIQLYSDNSHTTPITSSVLSIVANSKSSEYSVSGIEIEPWQAKLVIADGTYYKYDGTSITKDQAQTLLDEQIGAFKYWNNGKTYYFTNIQHNETDEDSKFAVIRNHKYVIDVTSITGLGTPVPFDPYDPDDSDDPTDPTPNPLTPPTSTPDPDYPDDPEFPDDPDDPTDGDDDDEEDPIVPEIPTNDNVSAIAAKIYVLQYRVVNQSVNLDGTHK